MVIRRIVGFFLIIFASIFLISSCALFEKKEKTQGYEKGKEGQWVYSAQKPSPTGDQKRATTYSKRPYAGPDGEDAALSSSDTKPTIPSYFLGRLKYKVVIAPFQDNTRKSKEGLATLVTQQLAKQLEDSGSVVLVDMELVKKSVGSGDAGALSSVATLWRLRHSLGVQGVVTGIVQETLVGSGKQSKTEESMAMTKMTIQLLDTDTGTIIKSIKGENPIYASRAVGELSQDKALLNAINFSLRGVTESIIRGLAGLEWVSSVASVEGDKIYLNAGKATGLKVGDELEIYNPGRQVKNSMTGVSLGRLPGKLQGKVKVNQFFGFDAAEAKLVNGGNITTGDEVRLAK